jgi:hypothetical protein
MAQRGEAAAEGTGWMSDKKEQPWISNTTFWKEFKTPPINIEEIRNWRDADVAFSNISELLRLRIEDAFLQGATNISQLQWVNRLDHTENPDGTIGFFRFVATKQITTEAD